MNILKFDTIETCWNSMESLDVRDIPKLVDQLGKQQPFILTYLMATGNDILLMQEREALLFMGVMLWQIVHAVHDTIPQISGEDLDECEAKNVKMLEYLAGEPERDFMDTVEKIMAKYHQPELLRFIIDRLMEETDKGIEISDDNVGMMVIYLKSIIDCLDVAIPSTEV